MGEKLFEGTTQTFDPTPVVEEQKTIEPAPATISPDTTTFDSGTRTLDSGSGSGF